MQDLNNKSVQEALDSLEANQNAEGVQANPAGSAGAQGRYRDMSAEAYARQQDYMNGSYAQSAAFNANGPESDDNVTTNANEAENVEYYDPEGNVSDGPSYEEVIEANVELQSQVADLRGQLDIMKQQVAQEHDKMLRAVAEADNVRKRAAQEVDRERKFALEKFVRSLLPVYDALEKALEFSDKSNESAKATIEGVETTLTLFLKEMSTFGVELVDPINQPFDPNFHQAVSMVPSPDVPNNHVLNTMQKGFLLNGRVVRPAMVIVSKGA